MTVAALALSLFAAALGGVGVASPRSLLAIVRQFLSPGGLYAGTALRVILGLALFASAPTSRAPGILRILGILILAAGLLTPLVGVDRSRRLLDWWAARGPAFMRSWAAFALVFGLLLAYAVAP